MDPAAPGPIKPLSTFTPQSDSSKFIRTYAKDVAALTGLPAPAHPPAPIPAAPSTTTIDPAPNQGIRLPEYDTSPVNRSEPASPKEFPQENVNLQTSDSEGIFESFKPAPAPEVIPPILPSLDMAAQAEKESILARLRAKVAAHKENAPPLESVMRTGAPDFSMSPEPTLPIPQVSKERVELPVSVPPPAPIIETTSPLHTYSSDFADRIDTKQGTTFSVLAAQSDAGQTPAPKTHRSALVPLLAGSVMLVIGIGAIAGAYLFTKHGGTSPTAATIPSLISYDESVEVKGNGEALMQAVAAVGKGGSVAGNVVVTYVTLATTTGSGIPQPGGVLIRQMALPAPDILLRNIDPLSTVGIIRAGAESRPFMILKVNSYQRTFAGMLAWEQTMTADLANFYPPYSNAFSAASSTATSTLPQVQPKNTGVFTDGVVANHDIRVVRDASGRSILLYGYRGKNMLIIARDEAAFTSLVSRLTASGD